MHKIRGVAIKGILKRLITESDKNSLTSELPEEEPPREGRQLFFGWAKTVKDLSEPIKASVVYADTTDT
jgi:hypothetical protein